jgi:DnaJ-class molecular chaperone
MQIPFNTAVNGGEIQIDVPRPNGKTQTIAVKIPAGIEDGKKIRIRGQGEPAGRRGTPGDILLTVHIAPHPCFQRRGNDLLVRVPITLGEAALGAKVDVPTPRGTVSVSVPAGSSSGTKLRVKGQGVSPKTGPAGDLFVELQVVLPRKMSEADRKLVGEIDQRYPQDPRAGLRW